MIITERKLRRLIKQIIRETHGYPEKEWTEEDSINDQWRQRDTQELIRQATGGSYEAIMREKERSDRWAKHRVTENDVLKVEQWADAQNKGMKWSLEDLEVELSESFFYKDPAGLKRVLKAINQKYELDMNPNYKLTIEDFENLFGFKIRYY